VNIYKIYNSFIQSRLLQNPWSKTRCK